MNEAQDLVPGPGQMLAPRQADLWWGMLSAGPGSYQPAPQGGGKVNGGGWEDTRGLQTTVPQSAISDMLERPGLVGQDGQLPSLLSTRPTSSVSCGTADIILFIGCNIRKPLWWWLWWWPSQWLPDVTVYLPACCPGNAKETWNEQGPDKQRWVAVVLWVACQRGCLLNHGLDHWLGSKGQRMKKRHIWDIIVGTWVITSVHVNDDGCSKWAYILVRNGI